MRLVRSISVLSALALAVGGCSDTPTAARKPAGAHGDLTCTGTVSTVQVVGDGSVKAGEKGDLTAIAYDAVGCSVSLVGKVVYWVSLQPSTATVDNSLVFLTEYTGVAAGNATITATVDGHTGLKTVQVLPPRALATIVLTPNPAQTENTRNAYFTATGKDQYNDPFTPAGGYTWSSSNTSVATINSSGVATGVNRGTVTITATSGSVSGTAQLTIIPYVLTFAPDSIHEGSFNVTSSVSPSGTYHYTWYEDRCTNSEPCTGYQVIASGTNVTSVSAYMSRYDSYRRYKLEIRDSSTGPVLNTSTSDVGGGDEMNPDGSCFPAVVC